MTAADAERTGAAIIIGAGAAGMMAAGRAAEAGARVLLLEKTERPGKKILVVPDLFDLHGQISHGQLMLDFRLVDLPSAGDPRPAKENTG